ncbi:hypothetical protein NYZ99_20690 [Maribacter litopenaei]|uniref:Lipocalin-like domain-containing protein n=1 Tax=Maribacter litopenaei TaxID=2976127 RepID=A0ABY5YAZ1_9FLAO|nr:hypothetical protein [Maribacter litopenaei]UWX55066.1 hypothetical protein NYZ99_20690 [Maribacter litopenaei]
MRKILILILTFLPITLFAQELKCCETILEVETYLNGNWKKIDSEPDLEYRFELNNGIGKFKVFIVRKYGRIEKSETEQPDIKILKTKKGFEIEHDFGGLKTYTGIKYLNSNKLIITRKDGAEQEYYKVEE